MNRVRFRVEHREAGSQRLGVEIGDKVHAWQLTETFCQGFIDKFQAEM